MYSRRKFLGAASAAAFGAVVASSATGGARVLGSPPGAASPTRERFERLVRTTFRVHAEALQIVPIQLVEVSCTARLSGAAPSPNELFSLVFEGPSSTPLPQRTYRMDHDEAGELAMFIVPVGKRGDALLYEAVFNQTGGA